MNKLRLTSALALVLLVATGGVQSAHLRGARTQKRIAARQQLATPAPTGYPAAGVTPEIPFELPNEQITTTTTTTTTVKPEVTPDNTYGPPDNTYGPPDNTYGPPDNTYGPPDNTYGPPAVAAPDNTYGPPADAADEVAQPELEEIPQPEEEVPQPEEEVPQPEEEVPHPEEEIPETNEAEVPQPELKDIDEEAVEEEELLVEIAEDGTVIAVSSSFDQNDADNDADNKARLVYQRFPQPHQRRRQPPTSEALKTRRARLQRPRVVPAKLQVLQPAQSFVHTTQFQRL